MAANLPTQAAARWGLAPGASPRGLGRPGRNRARARDRYGAAPRPTPAPLRTSSPSSGPGSRPGAPAASPQLGAPTPPPSLSLARPPRRNWVRVASSGRSSALRASPAETEATGPFRASAAVGGAGGEGGGGGLQAPPPGPELGVGAVGGRVPSTRSAAARRELGRVVRARRLRTGRRRAAPLRSSALGAQAEPSSPLSGQDGTRPPRQTRALSVLPSPRPRAGVWEPRPDSHLSAGLGLAGPQGVGRGEPQRPPWAERTERQWLGCLYFTLSATG